MEKHSKIEAKFIPNGKGTPLPQLYALVARAKEQLNEFNIQKKSTRKGLAKKILNLKKRAFQIGLKNGTRRERTNLILKALELDLQSRQILAKSHQEGLETIEAVCLSVFGQSLQAQKELLSARLRQSFSKFSGSGLSRIIVATGFKPALEEITSGIARIEENSEVPCGSAILETKSGRLEINVIEDLLQAFSILKGKLNDSL